MTQKERITNYIGEHGSISPMEAFSHLGITKLATQISEMRRDGTDFDQKWETAKNRFGEPVRYMMYFPKGTLKDE